MEKTLGKRILQNRKNLGMTQDQLAERIGVTAQAISKWENDQSCPDIAMLPRLAEIFGISTDELLGIAPPIHEAEIVEPDAGGVSLCQTPGVSGKAGGWEFHWDGGSRANIALALWLLLSGALLLLSNYLGWSGDLWGVLWPSWLVVFGAFGFSAWKFSFMRLLCLLFGLYFLLNNLRPDLFTLPGTYYLPIGLLIFGAGLLLDALSAKKKPSFHIMHKGKDESFMSASFVQEENHFSYFGSFCDDKRAVLLPLLQSGSVELSFGNLELDLTGCEAFAEDCRLDITSSFGELTLRLPSACRIKAGSNTAFGSLEISGECAPDAPYTIALDCDIHFGHVTVCYT